MNISVMRYDPERGGDPLLESYEVPAEEGATVMGALLFIYETCDSTLAFRYGCRNGSCGLCAMDIDGRPGLACATPLRPGMVLRPLQRLPVARDLMVDRQWIMPFSDGSACLCLSGPCAHGPNRSRCPNSTRA